MNEKLVREAFELFETVWPGDTIISHQVEEVRLAFQKAIAPEPRFYKNQPVMVRDGGDQWLKDNIIGLLSDRVNMYDCADGLYADCKPDPDAESIINWISFKDQPHPMEHPGRQVFYSSCSEYHASIPDPEFLS